MSTVKSLLYKAGSPDDVICSIDVSVAFLQSDPYPSDAPKRYVKYQPHKFATPIYAELSGPVYGLRSASLDWFKTLSKWLESEGYYPKSNERCVFVNDKGFTVVTEKIGNPLVHKHYKNWFTLRNSATLLHTVR